MEKRKSFLVIQKTLIKMYSSQNLLCKSWIERHWNIWKSSLIQMLLRY